MRLPTRTLLLLSTTLTMAAGVSAPAFAATTATPRPLAANEVLALVNNENITSLQQATKPFALPFEEVSFAVGSKVPPASQAKLESALRTLSCVGKPKLACAVTLDGKLQKVPTSAATEGVVYIKFDGVDGESKSAVALIKIKIKKPPIIIIIGKPVTA